jgi:plasminogen activator inhibitor 1 RNA-binding protein
MTLEEYEKIREENRKALLALKTEERKVEIDKDLQSMQLLSTKKSTEEVFIKLVSFYPERVIPHFLSCCNSKCFSAKYL